MTSARITYHVLSKSVWLLHLAGCAAISLGAMSTYSDALAQGAMNPASAFALSDPSLKNSPKWPPGMATSGTADVGPALSHSPVSAETLAGSGPDCTVKSPCAAVVPSQSISHSSALRKRAPKPLSVRISLVGINEYI